MWCGAYTYIDPGRIFFSDPPHLPPPPAPLFRRCVRLLVACPVCAVDPTEHVDLAEEQPALVAELHGKLLAFAATLYDPDRGTQDFDGACGQVVANGGFWGPWLPNGPSLV